MDKKIRFGLIGIDAQGGFHAGFFTDKSGLPGVPAPAVPKYSMLGAL